MRLGVCNLRRTARYTAPTPLFNSVWWIARPRTVSALKTPHTSPPCHPFVGVSSVIFPILFFSLPLYGGATHQLAELPDVRFGSKADITTSPRHVRFTPESGHSLALSECPLSQHQQPTSDTAHAMPSPTPISDIGRRGGYVCFVPTSDSCIAKLHPI